MPKYCLVTQLITQFKGHIQEQAGFDQPALDASTNNNIPLFMGLDSFFS